MKASGAVTSQTKQYQLMAKVLILLVYRVIELEGNVDKMLMFQILKEWPMYH